MAAEKQFYLLGYNVSYSLSPTIHNAAFAFVGLPYHYSVYDVQNLDKDEISAVLADPIFGGASVTVPHKLAIMPFLNYISDAAKKVGAVNTVVVSDVDGKRELSGENTDWSGIKQCIEDRLSGRSWPLSSGLVIGAGGAARAAVYALAELNVKVIYIYNRSKSKAEQIAEEFKDKSKIIVVDSYNVASWPEQDSLPLDVIVGNIPGDVIMEKDIPLSLFGKKGGVLVEMAYKPDVTPLMKVSERAGGWKVVRGTDILLEQGYAQFELWTGIDAPKAVMRNALTEEVVRRNANSK
ncbi:putative pentafunctional AROM polypeptide [Lipomyces chichibuensis]|uniref:putative pentafunctional AROM polypeptide n=1 Tax=Lipomyces chichibuensis TaxID=1546026 RepID=UPI003343D2E6